MKNKYFEAGLSKLALAFLALIIALPMTFMPSVANAISPTTIFSDGFEAPTGVGNWIESGWSSSSDGHGVGKSAKLVGAENAQTMQKNISTSGYENISLSFWYKAYDLDTSGHLDKVEVFYTLDGSSWVEVSGAQIDDNDDDNNWHQFSFSSFPSGANNNLNFGVKFDGDLNSDNDKVWVDDVSLTGASIPVPVNGGWSEWSPSSCPTAPGSPESQLVRTCTNPTPANGGRECQGEATQVCAAVPADTDQDGVPDYTDNCPSTANSNQEDRDGDGVGDACDNCISNANANQADENQNGVGDICEVPDEPTTGTIKITKYACPADTSVVRSANGVEGTVPPLCELQSGATFGFVHGTQTDANAPYPELTANLTAGGTTDGSGVLNITDLPADGRYLVVETDGNNTKIPDGDILGLYCVGDGDTSNNNDNQELTFVSAGGTVNCVAYNKAKEVPAPVCDPEKNLIANGGFENPLVETPEKWNTFASGFTGLEWIVNWLNPDGAPTVANLELHKTGIISGWNALEGVQYAELDTDFGAPPSNPGGAASVSIAQEIQTIPGKNYKLTFDFSPRPNRDTTENVLGVFWGGEQVPGSPVSAAGNGTNNVWAPYTFNFSATTSLTTLMFKDLGISNSEGTFLDNVSLTCQNEAEDPCTYFDEVVVSDETNMVGENPAQLTWTHELWVSTTTSAKWIWSDATVQNPTQYEVKTFTKTFTLNGNPTSDALLSIASDNTYKVLVNGNEIASTTNEANYAAFTDYVVPASALIYGENTITVEVHNWALEGATPETNPAGVIYALYVNTKNCPGDNPQEPDKLQVKIYKYLDGVQATAQSVNNYEFPMHAVWSWPASEQLQGSEGAGDYLLGLSGHGGSGSYEAFTSTMNAPAIYQTYERTSDMYAESNVLPIDSQCVEGKYRLKGYRWGNSPTEAQSASLSTTYPDFTNLTADKYVIVENETCPEVIEPLRCEQGYHEEENVCVLDEREEQQQDPAPTITQTSGGRRHDVSGLFGGGSVLGASTEGSLLCEPYLKDYIKFGGNNNSEEVKKLQIFLNQFFETNNPVTGFYGQITYDMVKKFQAHQEAGTLTPWASAGVPTDGPTGYVYKTTKRWINILKCPDMIASTPVPQLP